MRNAAESPRDSSPKRMSQVDENEGPAVMSTTALNRINAYKPTFNNTPDISALTGAGASLCASGSHVCMGASPAFVPYPIKRKTKANWTTRGESCGPRAISVDQHSG